MSARADSGFVLLEALAALAVTAIAAAGLIAALASARERSAEAGARDLALRQGRHLMAEATVAGRGIAQDRSPDGRLSWTRTITPHPEHESLQIIVVEVAWTAGRRQGETRLETIAFTSR